MEHPVTRVRHEPKKRRLVVREAKRLTPTMQRIVLEGPDLDDFVSKAPDDHIKVFVPTESGEVERRDYTPRRFDPSARTLAIDFALHDGGPRRRGPFVSVNLATIARELVASELFGAVRGAFTGAVRDRDGLFRAARGGTLFLDEVGEISPDTQVALLRVLQERRFERVGGTQSISSDVRVIAATNVDLDAAMNGGAFRRDLFYRLNVFPIHMPSLRERREDVPLLVEYFIERFATKAGKRFGRINKKSLDLLQSYHWPGNIRELQNVIERSVILCDTKEFSVDENWLAPGPVVKESKKRTLGERLHGEEKEVIEAALAETGGRVSGRSGAALKLGIPASTLYSKIQSLKIDKSRFKRD